MSSTESPDFSAGTGARFATKVAVLLADDIAVWQKLNVTAFLVSGIAASVEGIIGEPYEDADGTGYLPMIRQPVTIFEGARGQLASAHGRALERELMMAVYTAEMFDTGHDDANRAAVKIVARDRLDLVGIGLYGPRAAVDKALKGLRLHP